MNSKTVFFKQMNLWGYKYFEGYRHWYLPMGLRIGCEERKKDWCVKCGYPADGYIHYRDYETTV